MIKNKQKTSDVKSIVIWMQHATSWFYTDSFPKYQYYFLCKSVIVIFILKLNLQCSTVTRIIPNSLACYLCHLVMWPDHLSLYVSCHFLTSRYASAILIKNKLFHVFVLLVMLFLLPKMHFLSFLCGLVNTS